MKVLVYFSGELYQPKGTPIRVGNQIVQLQKNGADVYYAGQGKPNKFDDSHFLKLRSPLKRVLDITKFIKKNKIDIFYVQTTAGLYLGMPVKLMTRAKTGVDLHSLAFEEDFSYGKYGRIRYYINKNLERFFALFFDFATSVCQPLVDFYRIKNSLVLPVGVDTSIFNPDVLINKELLDWGKGSILLGYAGNTKWYQGFGVILDAFSKINKEKPGVYKLFLISSSSSSDIQDYIKENNLYDVIKFIGAQKHEDVPKFLAAADILAIPRPSTPLTENAFPSKFPEYAALGRALVVSDVSDIGKYVRENDPGFLIRPENSGDLYKALVKLENKELRQEIGKRARIMAEKVFDLDVLGKKLYSFLGSLK